MPFQVKGYSGILRCSVCGRIVVKPFVQLKTCCVNKPVILCSKRCLQIWTSGWLKKQEQIRARRKNTSAKRFVL